MDKTSTRTVVAGLAFFGVASALSGAGLYAFFSDTATSSNNLFTAGSVDLLLNDQQSIGSFIGRTGMKPGHTASGSVMLRNAGTLGGIDVDLDISLNSNNGAGYGYGSDVLTRYLRIQSLTYGGTLVTIADVNGNGFSDLDDWDLGNANTLDLADPGPGRLLTLSVVFDGTAPNTMQGMTSSVLFSFRLSQTEGPDQLA